MKKTLQIFTKITFAVLAFLGFANRANAQCAVGEVAVSIDVITDAYGYETYWELVPAGNACGVGTIFAGGNTAVGCGGQGAQAQAPGGYANSTTITEGPFCLTVGASYTIISVDDWGDAGAQFVSVSQGVDVTQASGSVLTYTFVASDPITEDLQALSQSGEYTRIPLMQVAAMPLTAKVRNNGIVDATDAVLTANVYMLPDTIVPIQTTSSPATAITSTSVVSLSAGTYLPIVAGNYRFEYIVSSATLTDVNPANDKISYDFSVGNDGMYARDNGDVVVQLGLNSPNSGILGNMFDINVNGQLDSVFFYAKVTIGDTTQVLVYNVAAGLPTTQIGGSINHVCTAADTAGIIVLPVTDLALAQLVLTPGRYFVAVRDSWSGFLSLGFTSAIYTLNGTMANISGGAFSDMGTLGFPNAAVVRPYINDVTVSVNETATIGSVSVYPNPTTGIFTISNSNGKVVNYSVTTIEGKIIKQLSNVSSTIINVDLSNENNGIYFLSVNGENTNSVFKIVKQ